MLGAGIHLVGSWPYHGRTVIRSFPLQNLGNSSTNKCFTCWFDFAIQNSTSLMPLVSTVVHPDILDILET